MEISGLVVNQCRTYYRSTDTAIILGIVILASVYSHNYNMEGYLTAGLGASVLFWYLIGHLLGIYGSWKSGSLFTRWNVSLVVTWLSTFLLLIFTIFAAKNIRKFLRVVLISWLGLTPILLFASRDALTAPFKANLKLVRF